MKGKVTNKILLKTKYPRSKTSGILNIYNVRILRTLIIPDK